MSPGKDLWNARAKQDRVGCRRIKSPPLLSHRHLNSNSLTPPQRYELQKLAVKRAAFIYPGNLVKKVTNAGLAQESSLLHMSAPALLLKLILNRKSRIERSSIPTIDSSRAFHFLQSRPPALCVTVRNSGDWRYEYSRIQTMYTTPL
jgi:hypothetical protein